MPLTGTNKTNHEQPVQMKTKNQYLLKQALAAMTLGAMAMTGSNANAAWKFGVISDTQWTGSPDDGQSPGTIALRHRPTMQPGVHRPGRQVCHRGWRHRGHRFTKGHGHPRFVRAGPLQRGHRVLPVPGKP
jgi:hypothetical protein